MKKGFTLIELLAVIVILAIIALIATPIVLNIIQDTKESATLRSADFYINAVENEIMLENMKAGGSFNPSYCNITAGNIICEGKVDTIIVKVDGEVPTSGRITFENGKVTSVSLDYTNATVSTNNKGELVLGEIKIKTLKDVAVVSSDLGVTSVHSCATSGTCEPGTAFAIQVNDTETYKFRVLSDDGNSVNLIMNENLDAKAWNSSRGLSQGPLTALEALKTRTSNWTNLEEYSYTLEDEEGVYPAYSGEYVQNVRARLPKLSDVDVEEICSIGSIECAPWIYEGLDDYDAYLLSDVGDASSEYIWTITSFGNIRNEYQKADDISIIRPVITLTK